MGSGTMDRTLEQFRDPKKRGSLFKAARIYMGLTREQVAEQMGVSASSIQDFEKGIYETSERTMEYFFLYKEWREKILSDLGFD